RSVPVAAPARKIVDSTSGLGVWRRTGWYIVPSTVQAASPLTTARDTRRRILDAAEEVFAARGFRGATTREIGARARVGKRMLFYYFPTKAGVYRAVLTPAITGLAEIHERFRDQPGPPERGTVCCMGSWPTALRRPLGRGGLHREDTGCRRDHSRRDARGVGGARRANAIEPHRRRAGRARLRRQPRLQQPGAPRVRRDAHRHAHRRTTRGLVHQRVDLRPVLPAHG